MDIPLFVSLLLAGHVDYLPLAVVISAAHRSSHVQVLHEHVFISLEYIPKSVIAGLYGQIIFTF